MEQYRLPQGLEAHYGTAPMEEDDENRYEETCTIDQGISEEGARHMDHPIDDDDDDEEEEDQMAPPIEEDEEDQDDAMAELAYDGANQYTTTYDGHQRARNIATRNRNNATEEMAHPEKEHQDDLVHDEDDDQVLEEDQEEDVVDEEQDEEDEDEQLEEEEEEEEEESGELQEEEDEEEDDESVDNRTDAELAAIALELQDLEESVPLLKTSYHLLDRLGEGTFSSVYKAIDLHHHLYDNSLWAPEEEAVIEPPQMVSSDARFHPSTSTSSCSGSVMGDQSYRSTLTSSHQNTGFPSHHPLADDDPFEASAGDQARNKFTETLQRHALESGKLPTAYKSINNDDPHNTLKPKKKNSHVYVALKRIYVTSSPFRIMNELKLLAELRDAEHVAYLIQAIRHEDQVIAVMPYRKHQDFREYYRTASIGTMRNYLRCLFSALKDTHSRGIIHRDIKPANFLFDIDTQTGVLCDFGLAEKFDPYDWYGKCLHSLPEPKNACNFHGKLLSKPKSTYDQMEEQWKRWRSKLLKFRTEFLYNLGRPLLDLNELTDTIEWKELFKLRPFDSQPNQTDLTNQVSYEWYQSWKPVTKVGGLWGGGYGKRKNPSATNSGSTSNVDNMIIDRVGFKKEDGRPSAKANRAGTRGFRAPEVLFKCPDQTGAIDIWSVGVTLLCFLTRRFPFFNSNDDVDALMEIATIFGRSKLESVALHHNRTVISNIPEVNGPRFSSLHTLVRTLNPTIYEEQRLEHAERTGGGTSTGLSGKSAPVGMDESRIDRLTNTIFQAHRELSSSVETLGQDLNPYNEPWYLRSELWYLVDLLNVLLNSIVLNDQIEARTGKFRRLKYIANCRIKTSDQLSQYAVDHVRSTLSYTQDLADQNPFENYRDQVKLLMNKKSNGTLNARQRNQKIQSTIDGTLSTPRPPEPHLPAYEALQARQKLLDEHHSQVKKPKVRKWRKILEPEKQALVQSKSLQQNGKISDLPGAYCESHDIRKLKPRQWINDEIVTFYTVMINNRSLEFEKNPKKFINDNHHQQKFLKAHCFNSFFMAKYDKTGYDGVKRWSKKTDLLSKDIIIFPTNIGNAHWTCAAINLRSKRFEYFDSMGNPNQSVLANLRDYIVHEALLKKKITLDISEWPDCFYQDIPQQNNSFDCGIFVCQFMDCISRDWTSSSSSNNNNNFSNKPLPIDKRESVFDFGQENMEYIRTKMIYEIATKEFLNEEWA
ncbi:hypothetical protein H4Q26_014843 [Puccinia striiformis f. sp. tritici PST-130]|nr:hypothetical protein H4Q26_014843 [Puccinia striiformis f. sp. tritici PST-130]